MNDSGISALSPETVAIERLRSAIGDFNDPSNRKQVITLLQDCAEFVGVIADNTEIRDDLEIVIRHPASEALHTLARAIDELPHGIVDPILKPGPAANRPHHPARQKEIRGTVRVLYKALREQGLKPDEAAKKIAIALNSEGIIYKGHNGNKGFTTQVVKNLARPIPK